MVLTTQNKFGSFLISLAAITLSLTACSQPNQTTTSEQEATSSEQGATTAVASAASTPIRIDGSSTVYPISNAIAQEFQQTQQDSAPVTVGFSGTGGGFEKFCAGETDINNASRPIQADEMETCKQAGVAYIELPVAFDALTVVVNPQNTWAKDITVEELKKIWEPAAQGKITKWNQVRASWPDRPIKLYGPGKDSGTFDYFTEAVVGEANASRTDYTASEDDDVLVAGIAKDPDALGYFGYAYYEQNQDKLKAIAVDSGKGPILPSPDTVKKAQYQPLARPLFIYVNGSAAQKNPAMKKFVDLYLDRAPEVVSEVGYVPLPEDGYRLILIHFNNIKVGTVFGGKSEFDLTISQLLRKEAEF